jgi:hypothetical protein
MSNLKTIAQRVQHTLYRPAEAADLEQDNLASLLLRPKCQHGDLRLLLRRRASLLFGSSELHHIEK